MNIGIIELFSIFFVSINILAFLLYMVDKRRAGKGLQRISERTLIFFTLACGGVGAFLGMCFLRHKTRKLKFKVAVAIGLIVAIIPIIHIVHSYTIDRIVRYTEIEFRSGIGLLNSMVIASLF